MPYDVDRRAVDVEVISVRRSAGRDSQRVDAADKPDRQADILEDTEQTAHDVIIMTSLE